MKPLKNKVSITLDSDIIEKIKHLAEGDERSFSQYINMVLKDHLNNNERSKVNKQRKTKDHVPIYIAS